MSTIPTRDVDMIQWFENRYPIWEENFAQINITTQQLATLKAKMSAARDAYIAQQQARDAAKNATVAFQQAANGPNQLGLRSFGSDLVKTIRAFAETSNNPSVYTLADVPPPAAPAPTPPPSQPTDITATIEPTGAITLRFKATSAGAGATYIVKRKLASETTFRVIGSASADGRTNRYKTFTDYSIPAGSNNFQYVIQGQRGSTFGQESAVFTVMIGVGGDGVQIATLKMAA